MSKSVKMIVAVVVIVLIVGGIWMATKKASAPTTPAAQVPLVTSVDVDVKSIDAEMSGISSDSASINSGLNDTPVEQGL